METITIIVRPQSKLPDGYTSWAEYIASANIFLLGEGNGDNNIPPEVEFHIDSVKE